jgi:hypothetical protein
LKDIKKEILSKTLMCLKDVNPEPKNKKQKQNKNKQRNKREKTKQKQIEDNTNEEIEKHRTKLTQKTYYQ